MCQLRWTSPNDEAGSYFSSMMCFSNVHINMTVSSSLLFLHTLLSQSNISTVGWITVSFASHIHVPLRMNWKNFADCLTFHLAPPSGQHGHFSSNLLHEQKAAKLKTFWLCVCVVTSGSSSTSSHIHLEYNQLNLTPDYFVFFIILNTTFIVCVVLEEDPSSVALPHVSFMEISSSCCQFGLLSVVVWVLIWTKNRLRHRLVGQ